MCDVGRCLIDGSFRQWFLFVSNSRLYPGNIFSSELIPFFPKNNNILILNEIAHDENKVSNFYIFMNGIFCNSEMFLCGNKPSGAEFVFLKSSSYNSRAEPLKSHFISL